MALESELAMNELSSLQLGIESLKNKAIDEAIEHLERATVEFPDDYRALSALGVAYAKKGMNNRAIGTLEAAVKLRPDIASIHYNLGLAYQGDGMADKAREHYERALALDPGYAKAYEAISALIVQPHASLVNSCAWHADEPSVGECSICHLSVCSACKREVEQTVYCKLCLK